MKTLKIFLIILSTIIYGVSLFAETITTKDGYSFHLKATRNGSEYKKGETAEFLLKVTKDGKPAGDGIDVSGTITKDSVEINHDFSGKVKNGKFSVKAKLDEAGFLRCEMNLKIKPQTGKTFVKRLFAGAAFDPLEIKPSLPAPDDFDAYWEEQKKILASIPMNIKITPLKARHKGIKFFDVQADSFNDKLSAYMAYPEDAKPKSLPIILTAHGAGVRSSSSYVQGWADLGFLALDFNAHGLPNGMPEGYYKNLYKGELKGYPTKNADSRDTIFFRTLYMRLMRAMEVVMAQPQWDGKNFMVFGGSQGGGQALAAGALNPKITVVVAMVPAICDHSGPVVGRTSGWPHFTRLDKNGNYDKKVVEAARYIDAVNFASRIKGEVIYMINYADTTCEPTTCYAAYNNIKTKKRLYINEESRHNPASGTPEIVKSWGVDIIRKNCPDVKPLELKKTKKN